jgi:hypothetical protein
MGYEFKKKLLISYQPELHIGNTNQIPENTREIGPSDILR